MIKKAKPYIDLSLCVLTDARFFEALLAVKEAKNVRFRVNVDNTQIHAKGSLVKDLLDANIDVFVYRDR